MKSSSAAKVPNGHGSLYKEVRFSPTATPVRRSHSVPNAHSALISDYTRILEGKGDSMSTLAIACLEESRSLLDRQRISFNHERSLFEKERVFWEKERELLKLRISELEALLKTRGLSTTAATGTFLQSALSDPSHHPALTSSQVWEGSSPASRPTRVFPDTENSDSQRQAPAILEQGGALILAAPSLDAALSPKSHAIDVPTSIPVPIEKLDSRLDGITLKSSALPPEVVARVMTPPSPSSPEVSPASSSGKTPEQRNSLRLKLSDLRQPENNLVRDAGHTPMAVIDADVETELPSPQEAPPAEGEPLAPSEHPLRQPAESSNSYFAGVPELRDVPDDPALKGPLSLLNEKEHDDGFLHELDEKLLAQAKQALGSPADPPKSQETEAETPSHGDEQDPEIKFKNSTNFGTAFGYSA